jgi:Lipopolysaccharide assembly protein A domain
LVTAGAPVVPASRVRVRFLIVNGTLPLGAALLFAALLGALLVLVAGAARVLQLRVVSRRHRRATSCPDLIRSPRIAATPAWDPSDAARPC